MSLIRLIGPVAIAAATFGLFDCQQKPIVMKYTQLVNCSAFDLDPNGNPGKKIQKALPGKMFMFYKIHSVDNSEKGTEDFTFLLSKVFAGNQKQMQVPEEISVWDNATSAPDQPYFIPKGKTIAPDWRFAIQVALDPGESNNATQYLNYKTSKGESVLMINVTEDGKPNQAPHFESACWPGALIDWKGK